MLINKPYFRRLLSYAYIQVPFSDAEKDSMAKKIPLPALVNDFTTYKKINIDGYALPSDTDCKITGWKISNKGTLTDYYGTDVDIEASTVVFLTDMNEARNVVTNGRRSLVSCFSGMGTKFVRTEWNTMEGGVKNLSWSAWTRFRPVNNSGNFITNQNDKMIDTQLEIQISNPYHSSMKESYPKEVLFLYRELLARTDYFKKNSVMVYDVF